MIQGKFGHKAQLFFEIDLISADGTPLTTDAILDTGFTGFLAINEQDIEALEWQFLEEETLITAQGEDTFDIYAGKIMIDNQEFNIPVYVGDEIQEILLGSQWLIDFPLVVNFQQKLLTLG